VRGPSVRKKRKEKEKKERGARVVAGWAGPLGCWSRAGPVRLLLSFFWFFFFSIFCPLFILGFGLNKALF
jgi:hypothetical protein